MSRLRVVGGAALRGGRVLMAQRRGGHYDGLWEFPGGKVEAGETDAVALARELSEELGIDVVVHEWLGTGHDDKVELHCYRVAFEGEARALEHAALRWVPLDELAGVAVPPPDVPTVDALLSRYRPAGAPLGSEPA